MKKCFFVFIFLIVNTALCMNEIEKSAIIEIAINTSSNAKIQSGQDGFNNPQHFVPILIYREKKLFCGAFIPFRSLLHADEGLVVFNGSDGSGNVYRYRCNQSNREKNTTFKHAFIQKVKENNLEHLLQ